MQEIEFQCEVMENRQLAEGQHLITWFCPEMARRAEPGQFAALSGGGFLRRPLGIARVDRERGAVSVGGRAKGRGMAQILALKPGDVIGVLGPLGHGYQLNGWDRVIVAGGGTGVYPMLFLLETLKQRGVRTGAAFGFRDRAGSVLTEAFRATADVCVVASEAGDLDVEGNILTALDVVFKKMGISERPSDTGAISGTSGTGAISGTDAGTDCRTAILTCGPISMMQRIAAEAAARGLACQVSLEERMACGVGLCLVCACKTRDETAADGWHYERCCKEGPVFGAESVVW